jgi:predicted phage terminase large subunit-like protein
MRNDSNAIIEPQLGPQTDFLETPADIGIYGGAAGGGKTFAILLEPTRHYYNPKFAGVIFRRTTKQVTNPGGLWDEAMNMYGGLLGATPKISMLEFTFPSGMKMRFGHLEHEKNVYDWQGSQIPFLGFDELTHFSESQFFYMLSRNRSDSGVPGYVRATTNPDCNSWVRKFIDWWIDNDTGLPISERSGKLRWFIRIDDQMIWADTREELIQKYGPDKQPKSVTFIPAKLSDNKKLLEKDPSYLANLEALPKVERERLLGGNWNVKPVSGMVFKKNWFEIIPISPALGQTIRYWDRAATEKTDSNDPDFTVGLKMKRTDNGLFIVEHIVRGQWSPGKVETAIKNAALQDGKQTSVGLEVDPGQAGKAEANNYTRLLAGFPIKMNPARVDKVTRALPVSAQSEAGNVKILQGPWNETFLNELEAFPLGSKDDQVDAFSGAFNCLTGNLTGDFTKQMTQSKMKTHAPSLTGGDQW